jgi:hypothetical protein
VASDGGCASSNGYWEPGELVQLTTVIERYSVCPTSAITLIGGTLSTTSPSITLTTSSSAFTNLGVPVGSTAQNSTLFEFTVSPGAPCGEIVEFKLRLTSSAGEADVYFEHSIGRPQETVLLNERFDLVLAPALPAGWATATLAGAANAWGTSTVFAATGPNSVYCADVGVTSLNELSSPPLIVPAGTDIVRVELDETHNMELDLERRAWDGGLMRLLISGTRYLSGAAGVMTPFYPWQMNRQSSADQPLQDLSCWSGNTTPGFAHYSTDFPDLAGQTINVLFDVGTDGTVSTPTGQFIDNVVVTAIDYECSCTDPPLLAVLPPAVDFGNVPAFVATCDTLELRNDGVTDLVISSITGCNMAPFGVDDSMTDLVLSQNESTTLVVCVTPTEAGAPSCNITVTSNSSGGNVVIPVSVDAVTAAGDAPARFDVVRVAPNPFNPETSIRFSLPSRMSATVEIWSVDGARVRTLARERTFDAGAVELRWRGDDNGGEPVASGIYFVRVQTPLGERVARAVLLK